MTIVAGFHFSDGLLFCADSLHTGYAHTTHEPKLFRLDCALGSFVFGYAGNPSFARAAILTCQRKLTEASDHADIIAILERWADKEYRRLVLSAPLYANDSSFHYRLLIGFRRRDGWMAMLSTEGPSLAMCSDYCCLGAGDVLANYRSRQLFSRHMSLDQIVITATYMVSRVKEFAPSCGGPTELRVLSASGRLTRVTHWDIAKIESLFSDFDALMSRTLFMISDKRITDEDFQERTDRLKEELFLKRAASQGYAFEELVRQISEKVSSEDEEGLQSTTVGPSHLPPSKGSPGGSGEP